MSKEATIQVTGPAPTECPLVVSVSSTMPIIPRITEMRVADPSLTGRALIWRATSSATTAIPMTMSVSSLVDMAWLSLPEPRLVATSSPVTERPLNQR